MKIFDITPVISSRMAVFPGDQAFERSESLSFEKGHHLTLSSIQATLHLGAHADAANHYHAAGNGIDQRKLSPYLGPAQVIEVTLTPGQRILPADVKDPIRAARVLFKTKSFPNPDHWNSDFMSLSPELLLMLAEQKVKLVGIDTPSVDPEDSKKLESHQILFEKNICVLEGIVLDQVSAGLYTLIALPLKIENADASPVRAILLEGASLLPDHFEEN